MNITMFSNTLPHFLSFNCFRDQFCYSTSTFFTIKIMIMPGKRGTFSFLSNVISIFSFLYMPNLFFLVIYSPLLCSKMGFVSASHQHLYSSLLLSNYSESSSLMTSRSSPVSFSSISRSWAAQVALLFHVLFLFSFLVFHSTLIYFFPSVSTWTLPNLLFDGPIL
jgi:hypothetical protein